MEGRKDRRGRQTDRQTNHSQLPLSPILFPFVFLISFPLHLLLLLFFLFSSSTGSFEFSQLIFISSIRLVFLAPIFSSHRHLANCSASFSWESHGIPFIPFPFPHLHLLILAIFTSSNSFHLLHAMSTFLQQAYKTAPNCPKTFKLNKSQQSKIENSDKRLEMNPGKHYSERKEV